MYITKIKIQNYKGIVDDLTLDLDMSPKSNIFTLVGLNESSKSTILEAIYDFANNVDDKEAYKLIPKSKVGKFDSFSGITLTVNLNDNDKTKIREYSKTLDRKINEIEFKESIDVTKNYNFKNSKYTGITENKTDFIVFKNSKGKVIAKDKINQVWQFVKNNLFPEIIFYRDFLSKFPEKIYLEPKTTKEHQYLAIVNDILLSVNKDYTIKESILERLKNNTSSDQSLLDSVKNELSNKVTKTLYEVWNKMKKVQSKEILITTGSERDEADDNIRYFIKFQVKDGGQSYLISDRSLGFSWFFTFLLYTEFRKERLTNSGEILFLLDEPASNLHQTAQQSLLGTFEQIAEKAKLVYTTHSHHLISPKFLGSTYVIKNEGLNYNEPDDYTLNNTNIKAYKYRQFVSFFPEQTDYYKPILDTLNYKPGMLEYINKIVIVEGKFDYFVFRYFKEIVFENNDEYNFYPGTGASQLDIPISMYESWGKDYLTLLDADAEGIKQQKRYIDEISCESKIFTLKSIDKDFAGFDTEKLFTELERLEICKVFNKNSTTYKKSDFNTGIQELFFQKIIPTFITDKTKNNLNLILGHSCTF